MRDDSRGTFAADPGGGAGFPVINPPVVQVKEGVDVRGLHSPGAGSRCATSDLGGVVPLMRYVQKIEDHLDGAGIYSQDIIQALLLLQRTDGLSFHRRRSQAQSAHCR
jgi:hypothetical protein